MVLIFTATPPLVQYTCALMASVPNDLLHLLPKWICMVRWHQPEVNDC